MEPSLRPASNVQFDHSASTDLYLWKGNGILLVGQREVDLFVLARGWIEQDRLSHVRRWRFTTAEQFSAQVHRLVMEASGDNHLAANERIASLALVAGIEKS